MFCCFNTTPILGFWWLHQVIYDKFVSSLWVLHIRNFLKLKRTKKKNTLQQWPTMPPACIYWKFA